jgi:uncharacterized membrane protein
MNSENDIIEPILQNEDNTKASEENAKVTISLNKARVEGLTEGVFAIVMTLLVIELKIPTAVSLFGHPKDAELILALKELTPIFASYFVSFAVLSMFWLSHNFLFNNFAKTVDRILIMLNLLYLSFIALIPFSASFLGEFYYSPVAVTFYGINILAVSIIASIVSLYIEKSPNIENHQVSNRVKKQGKIRRKLTVFSTFIGIGFAFIYTPLSFIFYMLPIIFNIIPGMLNSMEKIFGFSLGD